LPTSAALEQHQVVMHSDRRQMAELGRVIAEGVRPAQVETRTAPEHTFVCGPCGAGFNEIGRLNAHVKERHE